MREEGYYWIKHQGPSDQWEAVYHNDGKWYPMGVPSWVGDDSIYLINENRIPEPCDLDLDEIDENIIVRNNTLNK